MHAVTEGTDAQATVSVRIEENGKTTVGQAAIQIHWSRQQMRI